MKATGGRTYKQKARISPRIIDDQALSEAIRIKAKRLRSEGVKVKYDIGKMTRKEKVGFNGHLDSLLVKL
jgi:hypothetical protein